MADEILEALEEVEAELFPPKPGGLVDRHRKRMAQQQMQEQADEPIQERAYKAVKVAPESPESMSALTFSVPAGGTAQILPMSPFRYRATITLVTTGAAVSVARDQGAALGAVNAAVSGVAGPGPGFVLTPGVPVPVFSRGQMWAGNYGSSAAIVSVLAETYSAV